MQGDRRSTEAFLRVLERAAPAAVRTLSRELGISRRAAAEAFAASAGLGLSGLARHLRRRPRDPHAAMDVVRKYGRPADLEAPEIGIPAHLGRRELSPRLGGLLGDAGPRAADWIARRTGDPAGERVGKALAATAPLVLGALEEALPPAQMQDWLAEVPETPLEDPEALLAPTGDPAFAFRRLSRHGHPLWKRALGLAG